MENPNLNWIDKLNEFISRSVTVKLLSIAFIILLLLIPGSMITSLIREREDTMKQAVSEVTGKWSGSQQVAGPVLIIPYLFTGTGEDGKLKQVKKSAYFLPDDLTITCRVVPEKRYRGLYSIMVYRSEIRLAGKFSAPDFTSLGIDEKDVLWSQASLQLGIDDLRGIGDTVSLKWGSATVEFNPGITDKKLLNSGIAARLPVTATA